MLFCFHDNVTVMVFMMSCSFARPSPTPLMKGERDPKKDIIALQNKNTSIPKGRSVKTQYY